jgi:hypothetical protein
MGFAVVQSKYASGTAFGAGTGPSVTLTSSITAGNLLTAFVFCYDPTNLPGTTTIVDASANAYTKSALSPVTNQYALAGGCFAAYILSASGANKTVNVTFTNAIQLAAIEVIEWSVTGGTASYRGDSSGNASTGSPAGTITATATDLVVAISSVEHQVAGFGGTIWTGRAAPAAVGVTDSTAFGEGVGYILSAAGNSVENWTVNTGGGWDTVGMAFQFTASGGSASPNYLSLLGVGA